MKKFMKKFVNDNGFIALSFAVVAIALMSAVAITRIGVTDTRSLVQSYHALQELHLIRSEGTRSLKATENMLDFAQSGTLPDVVDMGGMTKEINSGFGLNTFKLRTMMLRGNDIQTSLFEFAYNYGINTLATAYVGTGYNKKKSNVELYGRKAIKKNTFAGYHYFTETDQSINQDLGDDKVYFYGRDEIYGKVRTNSDIWLKRTTGDNNGWPLFHDHVYTSGEIQSENGTIPYEEVFLDGYTENAPEIEYPETATAARTGVGVSVGEGDIFFAVANGNSYTAWYGQRMDTIQDTVIIYDTAADGNQNDITPDDSIDVQYLINKDTIWASGGSGNVANNSIFIDGELWLMGEFGGQQTWCSSDTMYLAGDILLVNTAKGDTPDGNNVDNLNGTQNNSDIVGLISERSIIIQYGFRHPDDSVRVKYNCGRAEDEEGDEDDGGIYIYAAMCALGRGETSMEDGTFSFQYQHPHKGLFVRVNNALQDSGWDNFANDMIGDDWGPLHFLDITADWPGIYCYPFYGPLWPETNAETYKERGTIRLFGSVAQRRRGFVHRSGSDPINYTDNNWDITNYLYGSPSNQGGTNAPGATGSGVGYQKSYHYDNRFRISPPPKFPEVQLKGGITQFDAESWYLMTGDSAPAILTDY